MSTKKVNAEQIDVLFRFIEQKGVKFYDLQLELVDHFASAIEAKWQEDPECDFTILMTDIYRNFKDHEFKRLIRRKMSALNRRSWRMTWSFLQSFLTWPRMAFTALAVFLGYEVLSYTEIGGGIFKWYALGLMALCVFFGIQLFRHRPRAKRFLVFNQTILLLLTWFNLVAILFVQLPQWIHLDQGILVGWQRWVVSGIMVVVVLILIGFFFYSRLKMHREMEKAFPQYIR